MLGKCDQCGQTYDDAEQWTICPHNPLGGRYRGIDFCRRHDLYGPCPLCGPVPREDLHPQTAAIIAPDIGGEG